MIFVLTNHYIKLPMKLEEFFFIFIYFIILPVQQFKYTYITILVLFLKEGSFVPLAYFSGKNIVSAWCRWSHWMWTISFMLVWRFHLPLSGFLANSHLAQVPCQEIIRVIMRRKKALHSSTNINHMVKKTSTRTSSLPQIWFLTSKWYP